jgi:hypothetical protein
MLMISTLQYLVCVSTQGQRKRTRQTKVSDLESSVAINEKIVGFQIAVQNTPRVAKGQTTK